MLQNVTRLARKWQASSHPGSRTAPFAVAVSKAAALGLSLLLSLESATSELMPAADMNALSARKVWEMDLPDPDEYEYEY